MRDFFRYKEISNLRMNNLSFYDTHVKICIESSKTDIYSQGNTVIIAKTNTDTCPVKLLAHYCKIAELRANSDEYIFRSLQFNKNFNKNTLSGINKPLSYTRAREILFKALVLIGCDKSMFGLHSLRSGGATQAANKNGSDRLFKAHGRWRSENARDGYVQDSLTATLYPYQKIWAYNILSPFDSTLFVSSPPQKYICLCYLAQ
jgi:hypothetical protein